jgi:hypothetical protein
MMHRWSPPLAALLLVVTGALVACEFQMRRPAVEYTLDASHVVESVAEVDGGIRVTFADGGTLELGETTSDVALHGNLISPGELLLVGQHGDAIGYATTWLGSDGCYVLNEPAVDDGSHILFRFALRLPKAEDFDPGPVRNGQFPSFREGFCINSGGEVVSYGS